MNKGKCMIPPILARSALTSSTSSEMLTLSRLTKKIKIQLKRHVIYKKASTVVSLYIKYLKDPIFLNPLVDSLVSAYKATRVTFQSTYWMHHSLVLMAIYARCYCDLIPLLERVNESKNQGEMQHDDRDIDDIFGDL